MQENCSFEIELKNATLSPLTKYENYCVEIICTNQSDCGNLIKYTWKQPSFELDLKNVEISLLSTFHQNATISNRLVVRKLSTNQSAGT